MKQLSNDEILKGALNQTTGSSYSHSWFVEGAQWYRNELNRICQTEPDTFDTKQQLPIDDVLKVIVNSNCSTIDKINIINALSEYLKQSI